MIDIKHPFLKYGLALFLNHLFENNRISREELQCSFTSYSGEWLKKNHIQVNDIKELIKLYLSKISLEPTAAFEGKTEIKYKLSSKQPNKDDFIYLASHIICEQSNIESFTEYLMIKNKEDVLTQRGKVKMSNFPFFSEYSSFTSKSGRNKPKINRFEEGLSIISTLAVDKPSLVQNEDNVYRYCIIPDLPIDILIKFVQIFKWIQTKKCKGLYKSTIICKETKGEKKYTPLRPLIFKGNFPNAPIQNGFGSLALLGVIGEFAKEAKDSESATVMSVLNELMESRIYMLRYGKVSVYRFNHHIVELASEGRLNEIIRGLYDSRLYSCKRRKQSDKANDNKDEVKKYTEFDLISSRFLQLFTKESFRDFMSFRAEYPNNIIVLFDKYFLNMEHIDNEIIESVKECGNWLNNVAYFVAKEEIEKPMASTNRKKTSNKKSGNEIDEYNRKISEIKAKVLTELENSIFASRNGQELMNHVIIRACRLINQDFLWNNTLFMDKVVTGEISLDVAKNLLTAYMRIRATNKNKED